MTDMPKPDQPMYNSGSEQIALGAMMLSPSAADAVVQRVTPGDFYQPIHARVYEAIVALMADSHPIDPVSVAHMLERRGDLARVGGAPYLHTLVSVVPSAANAGWHADVVIGWAKRRRVLESAYLIAQAAVNLEKDIDEVLDEASYTVHKAITAHNPSDSFSLDAIADDEYQYQIGRAHV